MSRSCFGGLLEVLARLVLDPLDIPELLEIVGTYARGKRSAGNDDELRVRPHVLDGRDLQLSAQLAASCPFLAKRRGQAEPPNEPGPRGAALSRGRPCIRRAIALAMNEVEAIGEGEPEA